MDNFRLSSIDSSNPLRFPPSRTSNAYLSAPINGPQDFLNQKPKSAKYKSNLHKDFNSTILFRRDYLHHPTKSSSTGHQNYENRSTDFYNHKETSRSSNLSLNYNSTNSINYKANTPRKPYHLSNDTTLKRSTPSVASDISTSSNNFAPLQVSTENFEKAASISSLNSGSDYVRSATVLSDTSSVHESPLTVDSPSKIPKSNSHSSLRSHQDRNTYNLMRAEDSRILQARRQETQSSSKDILTEKQKIAYVGIVYLILTEMYGTLGVQHSEAISSTSSFIKYFKRLMVKIYNHMQISIEEQKMIETLPRNNIPADAMAKFLISEGETIVVKSDTSITVSHVDDPKALESSGSKEMIPNPNKDTSDNATDTTLTTNLPQVTGHEPQSQPQSPETNTPSIGDEQITIIPAQQPVDIDVRATLILDLFLLMLSDEIFDSRSRFLLRRVSEELNYPWIEVQKIERRVTKQLGLFDYAAEVERQTESNINSHVQKRNPKSLAKRAAIFGLATVGGGLIIGLSAGLLAPAIGAGLGATLSALGVANAGAFFGSVGGTVLITTSGTLAGGGIAGMKIARRTRDIENLQLVSHIDNKCTNLIFTVPGWLFAQKKEFSKLPFSLIEEIDGDIFSLIWDKAALLELGASFNLIAKELASTTVMQTLQYTVLPNLLGPLSIPMWLSKLGYMLDNPWATGLELAMKAAPMFADALFHRVQGQRPVTLIGFSLGALHIFYVLIELAKLDAFGIIEDVVLLGAPISVSAKEWRLASSVVGGRFINGYSSRDWMLKLMFRTSKIGFSEIAGLQPVPNIKHVQNVDFSAEITSHASYYKKVPLLLANLGFHCSSMELEDSDIHGDSTDALSDGEGEGAVDVDNRLKTGAGSGLSSSSEFDRETLQTKSKPSLEKSGTTKPKNKQSSYTGGADMDTGVAGDLEISLESEKEKEQEEMVIDLSINSILDKSKGITLSDFKKIDDVKQGPKKKKNFFTRLFRPKKQGKDELDNIMYSKISTVISTSSRFSSDSDSGNFEQQGETTNFRKSCYFRKDTKDLAELEDEFSQFGFTIKELDSTLSTFVIDKDKNKNKAKSGDYNLNTQ